MSNKVYFCSELNNVLSCFHDKIMACCSGHECPVYIEAYRGEKIDWDLFKTKKKEAFELLTEENIDKSPCKGCFFLQEKKENDIISTKYNFLHISHWTHCNCGCIYCSRVYKNKKIDNKVRNSDYYDMLPLLKELYKHELLDRENLFVNIQGGDISVLKEFEPLVKEFLKQGVKEFYILSNNLKYQPIIKKLLDMNKSWYTTSLDCGSRETYKKLKRIDKFKDTVNNLKKYLKSKHPDRVIVKYIIIERFNDNIEEITKFINLMSEIGVRKIDFMIDNKYVNQSDLDKTPLPVHYKDLYFHFEQLCRAKNIELLMWEKLRFIVNKYFYGKI